MLQFDQPGDELRDDEFPDEPDEDEVAWFDCPDCGAAVHEDAPRCPNCGYWLSDADRGSAGVFVGRPVWWIVLGLLGLIATVAVLTGWAL